MLTNPSHCASSVPPWHIVVLVVPLFARRLGSKLDHSQDSYSRQVNINIGVSISLLYL